MFPSKREQTSQKKEKKEDLDITIKLWNQGIPFDETEKGALPFLKKAITKKGVEYCVTLDNERKRVHKELMDQIPSQLLFKVEQQEFQKLLARSPTLLHQYQKELTPSLKGVIDSMQREEELLKRSMDTYTTGTIVGKVASGEMWGPLETLNQGTKDPLTTLESEMNEEIIGQEAAIKAVCNRIRLDSIGMKERNRPVGVFMCVGPTGVGKTSLAKVLAKKIMGSEDQLIRLDMQTYTNEHSIENLLGAPVGYKDHEKSAAWIKALKKNPKSVILLDEIEKSHAKVRQIFLGAFDEGHFVDNEGKKVDCSQAIFVLTSNSGSREILFHGIEKKTTGKSTFWFGKEEPPEPLESLKTVVHRAIAEEFQPEFINRMDNILVFNKLDNPNLSKKIILRELDFFKSRAKKSHQVTVNWTSRLVDYLAIKGFSSTMGARPLKRIVDSKIGTFYTDAILRKEIKRKDEIVIDINENGMIQFSKVQKTP